MIRKKRTFLKSFDNQIYLLTTCILYCILVVYSIQKRIDILPVLFSLFIVIIALILVSCSLAILFYLALIIEKTEVIDAGRKSSIIDELSVVAEIDEKEIVAAISVAILTFTRKNIIIQK